MRKKTLSVKADDVLGINYWLTRTEVKTLSPKENGAFSIGYWLKGRWGGADVAGNIDPLASQAFWYRVAIGGPGIKAIKKPQAPFMSDEDVYNAENPRPS